MNFKVGDYVQVSSYSQGRIIDIVYVELDDLELVED